MPKDKTKANEPKSGDKVYVFSPNTKKFFEAKVDQVFDEDIVVKYLEGTNEGSVSVRPREEVVKKTKETTALLKEYLEMLQKARDLEAKAHEKALEVLTPSS